MEKNWKYLCLTLWLVLASGMRLAAQDLPRISLPDSVVVPRAYLDAMPRRKQDALVVVYGTGQSATRSLKGKALQLFPGGKVRKYTIEETFARKVRLKRILLSEDAQRTIWEFIERGAREGKFTLDPDRLNLATHPSPGNLGLATSRFSSHSWTVRLELYRGRFFRRYYSACPELFIADKCPGWTERQRLLDLIAALQALPGPE
ncbi:MAG: hypothetical protein AAGN35_21720 [Bacteroidota bacterium]